MTTTMGSLVVNLEANIANFTTQMNRASEQTEQAMKKMDAAANVVKSSLIGLGAGVSFGVIVGEVNKVLDSLAALDDMAQKTGSSVETLSKLSKVAAFTGTDLGAVDGILVKLSKNLASVDDEGNKTAKALSAIGISTGDLKSKDPAELFVEITNKLQNYRDGAGKVALVTDLMGKSAADLLPYMNDVAESLDKFTADSTKAAGEAAKLQDELGKMKVKYDDIQKSIVTAALPATLDFIEAIKETTKQTTILVETPTVTWADEIALVMARMADGGSLVWRTFRAVNAELTATAAHIELMDTISKNVNPVGAAKVLATGGSPTENINAAMDKHQAMVDLAYSQISSLWVDPMDKYEKAMQNRIAMRPTPEILAALDGPMGWGGTGPTPPGELNYGGGGGGSGTKPTTNKGSKAVAAAPAADVPAALARMRDLGPDPTKAERMVELMNDQTSAIQNTINSTLDLMDADQRRWDQQARAYQQSSAQAEQIRQSLMSNTEAELFAHDSRMQQLQVFSETSLSNQIAANALMEQEIARHEQAKYQMRTASNLQTLGAMGDTADMMYNMLQQSGQKQNALAKAAFLASKAIAVAEIIVQTNLAASKAEGELGIFGLPASAVILANGYARAAMVGGMAIASAEGGYDIPAGVNPVTQLHEKEMVLPKAQAEVIRGLAVNGGGGNRGAVNVTYSPQIHIDGETDMAKNQKLISMAVQQGNADLVDRLQRAGRI